MIQTLTYNTLHVERRKVTRTKAAKANAEAHAAEVQISLEELEDQLEQLTLKNEQLEMTMSKLLEKWAQEKQLASDTLQDCRRKVSALQAECQHAPETLKQAVEKAQQEGNKFALMEKGVYTEEARQLCRALVQAGCSQAVVGDIIEEVLAAAGISVHGPKMSKRTVA